MDDLKDLSSIGETIKAIRQEKGISQEELIDKTRISLEFLVNLEELRYSRLPSVAYSLGLIENLLETLDVAPADVKVFLEKASKELEKEKGANILNDLPQEVEDHFSHVEPVEEKKNMQILMWIIGVSLMGLLLLFYAFFEIRKTLKEKKRMEELNREAEEKKEVSYSFYERFDTFNLNVQDKVRIFLSEGEVVEFTLRKITDQFISFDLDSFQDSTLSVKNEIVFDIDQNGKDDISIKYQKMTDGQALVYFEILQNREENVDFENIWKKFDHVKVNHNYTLMENSSNRFLIEVFIKATTLPVYLSYNVDGTRQDTMTLKKGEQVIITAKDHLQVQVGNYRTAIFVLNRRPINLLLEDSEKYSITKIIKWLPGVYNETKSDLVIQDYMK